MYCPKEGFVLRGDPSKMGSFLRTASQRVNTECHKLKVKTRRRKERCCMTTAEKVVKLLKEKKIHISTAESCTGGMIASGIVDVSGASDVFEEGYVTYSDRVKMKLLGVKKDTLDAYTVVSAQVAEEMAEGVSKATGSELTVSVTGYAGPSDGEDGTPAGTVFIGTFYKEKAVSRHYHFKGDRQQVRLQARESAFELILERLEED